MECNKILEQLLQKVDLAEPLPSARQIAVELNRRGIKSATGGQWSSKTVTRLRERLTRGS